MTAKCGQEDAATPNGGCGCDTALLQLQPRTAGRSDAPWTDGVVHTAAGDVPRVRTILSARDHLGTIQARCAIGRMHYRVPPGLYAVGNPAAGSPVLVTANFKMSFDSLRSVLPGRDAWILVLDTAGINVWCAAGKGTFGTAEIVRRVKESALDRVVSHRTLILPQLGAPGVAAHGVHEASGFRVVYGPVRAEDLPEFLDARMKARPEMRRVRFGLRERAVLIPVELVTGGMRALLVAAAFLLLGGLGSSGYSLEAVRSTGVAGAALILAGFLGAGVLGPLLLPWLPGRPFSVKGAALGVLLVGALAAYGWPGPGFFGSWLHAAAWAVIVPAVSSFLLMNFTGATTYTSLSGVLLEMRFAVPAQIAAGAIGVGLWLTGLFVTGGPVR